MQNYFLIILLVSTLVSCNKKAVKEKLESEKATQIYNINHIVGIGKIIPENDIIQLSRSVNGVVQKIYKIENDTVSIGTIILELDHHIEDAKLKQLKVSSFVVCVFRCKRC